MATALPDAARRRREDVDAGGMTMADDIFNTDRPLLFSIAYRMLGSASDAEDVLQDGWVRYSGVDPATIRSPRAFATTIVTRLCLDRLKSARATREEYIGPWLPEPVLTSEIDSPHDAAQRAESVTLAFLVLLETLSPEERAVFLLKDIFEYGHGEIAAMLGMTPEKSRQLLHRAKSRLAAGRPRLAGSVESRRAVAERFTRAFATGDGSALQELLAQDVGMWSDGGGKASAARRPLLGRDRVLNFLVGLHRTAVTAGLTGQTSLQIEDINSEPALIIRMGHKVESIFVFTVEDDAVTAIRVVRNPDKLARIARQLAIVH
jgi:RNA polymerase sigma-70 factor (ECF subfamily)